MSKLAAYRLQKLGLELARTLQGGGLPRFPLAVAAAVEFCTIAEHMMGVGLGAVRDLTRLVSLQGASFMDYRG